MEGVEEAVDLSGEFHFKIDSKGRMSLPAKFRKELSDDLVVTLDPYSDCLRVYENQAFKAWVSKVFDEKFGGYRESDRMHQSLRRQLKRRAQPVQIDTAGRIMVPAELREQVGLGKDVVIIGNSGYFEIWDAKRCDAVDEQYDLVTLLFD